MSVSVCLSVCLSVYVSVAVSRFSGIPKQSSDNQKNTVNYTKNFQVGCGSWYIAEERNIPGIQHNSSVPYDGSFILRHVVRGSAVFATSGPNTCYHLDFTALISTEHKRFSKGS
jgi:hypothetical protein